jgi:hypothetical protein
MYYFYLYIDPAQYDGQVLFGAIQGNDLFISLDLMGNPFPTEDTLMWTFNGSPLMEGGAISFGLQTLSFSPIAVGNAGTYTVTSSNMVPPPATFELEVQVFCKEPTTHNVC